MLKIARIAIKKNAAFSDCIVVFGVKPYIVAKILIVIRKHSWYITTDKIT